MTYGPNWQQGPGYGHGHQPPPPGYGPGYGPAQPPVKPPVVAMVLAGVVLAILNGLLLIFTAVNAFKLIVVVLSFVIVELVIYLIHKARTKPKPPPGYRPPPPGYGPPPPGYGPPPRR